MSSQLRLIFAASTVDVMLLRFCVIVRRFGRWTLNRWVDQPVEAAGRICFVDARHVWEPIEPATLLGEETSLVQVGPARHK